MPMLFAAASAVTDATETLLDNLEVNASAMDWHAGEAATVPSTSLIDKVLARYQQLLGD
jgi:hypothetical protein